MMTGVGAGCSSATTEVGCPQAPSLAGGIAETIRALERRLPFIVGFLVASTSRLYWAPYIRVYLNPPRLVVSYNQNWDGLRL